VVRTVLYTFNINAEPRRDYAEQTFATAAETPSGLINPGQTLFNTTYIDTDSELNKNRYSFDIEFVVTALLEKVGKISHITPVQLPV